MGEGRAVQGLCFLQGEGLLVGGHPHSAAGQGRRLAFPLLSLPCLTGQSYFSQYWERGAESQSQSVGRARHLGLET